MDDVSDKPTEPNELFAIEGYEELLDVIAATYTENELCELDIALKKFASDRDAELARRKTGATDTNQHNVT